MDEKSIDRIIEMVWEDRTPFEAIEFQFGLKEMEVVSLMRRTLHHKIFKLWRARVHQGISQKHGKLRHNNILRFKCDRQRMITSNNISKR